MPHSDEPPQPPPEDPHRSAVERVIERMRAELDQELTLDQMAETAIMSPYHFNRIFSRLTGVPPCRFLTTLRLEAAKRHLLKTDLNITDIALEVGYNSLGTFTRRFTELVGLSPSKFRRLAVNGGRAAFENLRTFAAQTMVGGGPAGRLVAPDGFNGPVFIGVFPSAIPQGRPIACALTTRPNAYRLPPLPTGDYYVLTVGLEWSLDPVDYFLYERALRGGVVARSIHWDGDETEEEVEALDLELRAPETVDPPILMTFPVLLRVPPSQSRSEYGPKTGLRRLAQGASLHSV